MTRYFAWALVVLLVTALLLGVQVAAPLRAQDVAASGYDHALLRQAFPSAETFGPFEGTPPAAAAYRRGELAGYVFSSHQVVQSKGYSAKTLDVIVGLGLDGRIAGTMIAEHHEPILIIGVGHDDLDALVAQYRDRDIRQTVKLGSNASASEVDAVSGATISSLVIHDAILRSARAVARSRGLFGTSGPRLRFAAFEPASWGDLLAEGSLRTLTVSVEEVRQALALGGGELFAEGVPPPAGNAVYLQVFAGLATPLRVGRNLLSDQPLAALTAELGADDQLVFVAGSGLYSFKGRAYRQSGVFDRLEVVQGDKTFHFHTEDHHGIETLAIEGSPDLREIAIFILRAGQGFDPSRPWRLQFLLPAVANDGATPTATFDLPYSLPERYLSPSAVAADTIPTTPDLWIETWWSRASDIAILAVALLVLTTILVFQDSIVKRRRLYERLRLGFLIFTLVWLGWLANAQLSLVNVLTFLEAVMTEFRWDFFLLEPLIFMLWGYVALMMLFLGRGVFCGWLCPFGALQELLARIAIRFGVPQWRLPFGLHERLWPIKYIAFVALFALFLHEPALAIKGAEIEPFKTAIILKFDRAWPFVLYVFVLLAAGLFVTRAYCRYLCPLGAALALPARVRMFEWLKRRWQCGTPCQTCAQSCPVQAIHREGQINPNECIHCLTCQVNYNDDVVCPPLAERKRRRARAQKARDKKAVEDGGTEEAPGAAV